MGTRPQQTGGDRALLAGQGVKGGERSGTADNGDVGAGKRIQHDMARIGGGGHAVIGDDDDIAAIEQAALLQAVDQSAQRGIDPGDRGVHFG